MTRMVCGSGVSSSAAMTAKVEGTIGCKWEFESPTPRIIEGAGVQSVGI